MTKVWTHDRPSGQFWLGEDFDVAQCKLDGWRCTFFKQEDGRIIGFGREYKPHLEFMARFPRLHDHPTIQAFNKMQPMSSIDTEITTTAECRSDVTTALRDPSMPLVIRAFAIPFTAGLDCFKSTMEQANTFLDGYGIPTVPYLNKADFDIDFSNLKNNPEALELARVKMMEVCKSRFKTEGWMLKSRGQYGKWYKVKDELDVDCVITSIKPGTNKYTNMVGALGVSTHINGVLTEVAFASGMTDQQRKEMTAMHAAGTLLGQIVEIRYQNIGAGTRLVHPRFVRFRPDKSAALCTLTVKS